nr:hypothetical protein [Tanacetum cinerariifolium]
MDKRKRFKLTLEIFIDIFKICHLVQGQDFDALSIDEEIMSFLRELAHTREINSLNNVVVDHMHQPWRTFVALINKSLFGKTTGLDKLRLSRAQILWDKTVSWSNKIGMHTSKDDYLINTLRFVSAKEATQIYGAILPESLTSPEMKETTAYKTYLGGVVIRETPKMQLSKKKEKITVEKHKWIDMLSKVALTKEAQFKEVRKKSLMDFHKTQPSGSGTASKTTPSAAKIEPSVTNKGTGVKPRVGVKPGVPDVTEKESSKTEGDEDEEMDYTISQLYDDMDIRLNEPVNADEGFIQKEGINDEMINIQRGNDNPEISQVIKDAHVILSTVP